MTGGAGLQVLDVDNMIGRLLEAADPSRLARVHLTVQEERAAARGLYESLGFHTDASIRGYRGMWTVG